MIKVDRLNKYFNKNKNNEIHVINNISLSLPEKGLVALFGASGCGKTTLLNVIGGLDDINSGSITIGDTTLTKYDSRKWDNLRNREVGYVFQNYNLLNDISVKENIDISLRLAGLEDKEERDERTMHVLEALGIAKYKNRRPDTLSGGQQQRVAIARAIAKHPNIVIADEPTGNLDAKNTIATMDILKQISRNCLVLLVTHEPKIVDYYADKVIQLSDGEVIKTYDNQSRQSLSLTDKGKIYLKDLKSDASSTELAKINYYGDQNAPEHPINLTVVCIEGKYFIKADTNVKVELVEKDGEIELLDQHYVPRSKEDAERNLVDLNIIKPIQKAKKTKPLITHGHSLQMAAKKFFGKRSKKSKLGNFGFAVSAVLLVISISMMGSLFNIDRTSYATAVDNIVRVERLGFASASEADNLLFAESIVAMEGTNGIYKVYPNSLFLNSRTFPVALGLTVKKFNQVGMGTEWTGISSRLSYAPIENFSGNLEAGRMPINANEIILDRLFCDLLVKPVFGVFNTLSLYGYDTYLDFLNEYLVFTTATLAGTTEIRQKIVGISQADQLCYWGDEEVFYSMFQIPEAASMQAKKIKMIASSQSIYIYSTNKQSTIDATQGVNITATDLRIANYELRKERNLFNALGRITFTFAVAAVALVTMYFIIRSSMFTRIKEIGVYRCLGAKKSDIRRMFLWEALVISLFTTVIGFAIGSWIVVQLLTSTLTQSMFFYPLWLGAVVLGVLMGLNILFGLLPVNKLLKLKPAQIMSKYDI